MVGLNACRAVIPDAILSERLWLWEGGGTAWEPAVSSTWVPGYVQFLHENKRSARNASVEHLNDQPAERW